VATPLADISSEKIYRSGPAAQMLAALAVHPGLPQRNR
jgi:hypothetical protein